jgi:hypothetical protein
MTSHTTAIQMGLDWLKLAQDKAGDGGVAAWFSLVSGWKPSYIETTGYVINTFLDCAEYFNDPELKVRAITMADFLVEMQHQTGGYRSVVPHRSLESEPVVFNTGQDLLGMTDIYSLTKRKKYLTSLTSAADFLVGIQEPDGFWIQYQYGHKSHAYDTRVAWGLLKVSEIYRKLHKPKKAEHYKLAAIKNLEWALTLQQDNGWFQNNELPPPNIQVPYTHTISYVLEGLLWSGKLLKKKKYIKAVVKGAHPVAQYFLKHHFLPGTFDSNWSSSDHYTCLTGDAQLSLVWLELYELTHDKLFLKAAIKMNLYLKSIQNNSPRNLNTRGAIGGSWPLWGDLLKNKGYCRLSYPNWATKFFIDALLKEQKLKDKKYV